MKKSFLPGLFLLLLAISVCSAQTLSSKIGPQPVLAPSATEFLEGTAYADGGSGVALRWTTVTEIGNIGFNLYRVDAAGIRQQINSSLIGGSILRQSPNFPHSTGSSYSWYDAAGSAGAQYYIESVGIQGGKILYGPVSPLRVKNISSKLGFDPRLNPELASRQSGTIVNNQPVAGQVAAQAAESNLADPVKQKWVAAQPGVKMQIRQSGFYRVSRAALQAAGFNVATDPAFWQLYVDGEQQKMIVEPSGNYIEFYGNGVDNQSTDSRMYYLLVGPEAGQRIASVIRRAFGPPALGISFRNITTFEERINYVSQITNGDADNWWGAILSPNTPVTRNINLKDINPDRTKAFVEISLHGFLNSSHNVQLVVNGTPIGSVTFDGITPTSKTFSINASHLINGSNSFELTGIGGATDYTLLKSIKIDYPRFYISDQNRLAFETIGLQGAKVSGFNTANVRVFDMVYPNDPQLIINTSTAPGANGFDVFIPSGRAHPMIAVNENGLLSPVAITQNAPSQLSAGTSNADMLIISHANFMAGANNWATYRRADALNVDVINVEDIYDEFDYGLPTPLALKSYLQYAKTNYPNIKYVLFVGDATYDPRNYLGAGYNDFIPTRFINTDEGESPSDEILGDFNNDGVSELALGRLPVRTNAAVTLLLGKTTAFDGGAATGLLNRGVFFVADQPDGYPFADVNRRLRDELPPNAPILYVDLLEDPSINVIRTRIRDGVNGGRFIVNYTGHGAPGIWSTAQMLRIIDVPAFTNNNSNLSLFTVFNCLNGVFTDPSIDWLSEVLLKSPNGAASAVWSSTGSTTPDFQEIMSTRFYDTLGQGTYTRLGDGIRDAKLFTPSHDVTHTWVLLGDPALHIK